MEYISVQYVATPCPFKFANRYNQALLTVIISSLSLPNSSAKWMLSPNSSYPLSVIFVFSWSVRSAAVDLWILSWDEATRRIVILKKFTTLSEFGGLSACMHYHKTSFIPVKGYNTPYFAVKYCFLCDTTFIKICRNHIFKSSKAFKENPYLYLKFFADGVIYFSFIYRQ